MKPHSGWRAVRLEESRIRHELRGRHALWLHGGCIGLLVVAAMALAARLLHLAGWSSLGLRYLATLGVGYLVYLLAVRLWAGALVARGDGRAPWDASPDVPDVSFGPRTGAAPDAPSQLPFGSGRGGDFGGGGASGDFGSPGLGDAGSGFGSAAPDVGDIVGGAAEVVGGADDGAVVVVPVVAVFLVAVLVLFGAGSLLLLFFGSEVLLATAVELAFGYTAARTLRSVDREGWFGAAVRLTWKPLLGAVFCALALGFAIDTFLPTAHSLPQAVRLLLGAR